MKEICVLILCSALCACGTTGQQAYVWEKPGVTEEQKKKDISDCNYSVLKLIEPEEFARIKSSAAGRKTIVYLGESDAIIDDTRRNRRKIFDLCMEFLHYERSAVAE